MALDSLTIAVVAGVLTIAVLWAFKDKLCPGVPEWWGIPGYLSPCWWYGAYCTGGRHGNVSNTWPAQTGQLPLPPPHQLQQPPLQQQVQLCSASPVATIAIAPALSTPQPIPVAVAVGQPQPQSQLQTQ